MFELGEDAVEFVFGAGEACATFAEEFGSATCALGKGVDVAVFGSELCEYFFEFGERLCVCCVGVSHFVLLFV